MPIFKLRSKRRAQVIVEIGDQYVKLFYAQNPHNKNPLYRYMLIQEEKLSEQKIVDSIKKFIKTNSIDKSSRIIIGIPSFYAIYRNIEIPSADKKEINQIIELQIGSRTPYPKNEIVFDYSITDIMLGKYSKILLVIMKRNIILKRYDILRQAGYEVDEVYLVPEPVTKFLFEINPEKKAAPFGILHIDIESTDFAIAQNGSCMYIRSMPYGSQSFKADPRNNSVLLLDEMKKTLDSYKANNITEMPCCIYMVAEKILADNISGYLSEVSGIRILPFNFTHFYQDSINIDKVAESDFGPSFLYAFALIFAKNKNRMNFVPYDIKLKNQVEKSSQAMVRFGISLVILFIIFCAVLLTHIAVKDLYFKKISSEFVEEEQKVKCLENITVNTRVVKEFIKKKGSSLNAMSRLYNSIPDDIYLNSIKYDKDKTLMFTGSAVSMSRIFSFVTELENNEFFKDVKVDFTRSRRQSGVEVADFGLTLVFLE